MAHKIEKPVDKVFSTKGTEWHDLAEHVDCISELHVKQIAPKIIESPLFIVINDEQVPLVNHKTLVADYSDCNRTDLNSNFVPLHIPKTTYTPIDNATVYAAASQFCKEHGLNILTAGTLDEGKKFFLSVDIGSANFKIARNETAYGYMNFITAHDGTLAMQAYDSLIRIVCMNTLRWSLDAAGDVKFKVYHTKNASLEMENLPELINLTIENRKKFAEFTEELDAINCSKVEVRDFMSGYYAEKTEGVLSARAFNAIEHITHLFEQGQGNRGSTRYDLLNGVTEYYTHGDGTGKKTDRMTKISKSAFGTAADHKSDIAAILHDYNRVDQLINFGQEVYKNYSTMSLK